MVVKARRYAPGHGRTGAGQLSTVDEDIEHLWRRPVLQELAEGSRAAPAPSAWVIEQLVGDRAYWGLGEPEPHCRIAGTQYCMFVALLCVPSSPARYEAGHAWEFFMKHHGYLSKTALTGFGPPFLQP